MTLPTSISNLASWFKADAGTYKDSALTTAATADGDPVGGWVDQSGNAYNALQSTSANRPTLKLNQQNSLPTILFTSASSTFLTLGTALGRPRNYTIFCVMAVDSPTTRQIPHGSISSAGASDTAWGDYVVSQTGTTSASANPNFGDGTNNTSVYTPAVWVASTYNYMTYIHRDNDTTINVWKNGTQQSVTALSSAAYQNYGHVYNFSLGREGDYNGLYLQGHIGEFIVYNGALVPSDRASVESYLSTRWGI